MMYTKIGIFDSGIGGVTVLKKCIQLNPNFDYLYYSDSLHNPYGDKSGDEVRKYCNNIVKSFISRGCKIIIVACNTASAMAIDYLRRRYADIHFIAIEPAIKIAYDSNLDATLVLATKGTMDSEKFHDLYEKYHRDDYYLVSCVGLANLIEGGYLSKINDYLKSHLSIYRGQVSNVVLGCTHYPLIKRQISSVLGNVNFYDGSDGVAKRLRSIILEYGYIGEDKGRVYFEDSTGNVEKRERFYQILESNYE